MPEISIIVPVYNCEKYIKSCVDSILNQSFKDWELILVNDGSSDGSGKICDELSEEDNRIKVIHQKNGGVSKARNVGIENSRGEFIGFIDADDFIASDMYEFLYNNLKLQNADVSICGILNCFVQKDGSMRYAQQSKEKGKWILTGEQALGEALKSKLFSVNPVNKLFKKHLFENARYPEGKISEDAFLIPQILSKTSKVIYDSDVKYYYVRRENTITTSDFSSVDWHVTEAYESHLAFVKAKFPNLVTHAEFRYLWSYTYVLDKMIVSNIDLNLEDYHKALNFVKKNAFKIFCNPYFSLKRKIVTAVLLVNEKLYKKIVIKSNER